MTMRTTSTAAKTAVPIKYKGPTCAVPKAKSASSVVKVLQRINPLPVDGRVRFDKTHQQWAILNANNEPRQHFYSGLMENVTFCSVEVKEHAGCGPARTTHIGVAGGQLYLHRSPSDLTGAQNLRFADGKFLDVDGQPIKTAKRVALMPDRRALYWE